MHRRFAPRFAVAVLLTVVAASSAEAQGIPNLNFEDLAKLEPGLPECTSQWSADHCYDKPLPPRPSHMRSQVVNKTPFPNIFGHDIELSNVRWWGPPAAPSTSREQTWQFGTRSTLDGRLNITAYGWQGQIGVFYPENLNYGFRTKTDAAGHRLKVRGGHANLKPWMRIGADTTVTDGQLKDPGTFYNSTGGSDLCNEGEDSLPYPCKAFRSDDPDFTGEREGGCYDVSLISSFAKAGTFSNGQRSEIRSTALTIFVENAERIPRTNDGLRRKVWIYPRSTGDSAPFDAKGFKLLPDYKGYDGQQDYETLGSYNTVASTSPWWLAAKMQKDLCRPTHQRDWCEFFDNQTYNATISVPDQTKDENGYDTKFRPIELSTTGDGKVVVGQDARGGGVGFFYAHSPNACDASGWTTFKPLSRAYSDPAVHGTYGFAEYPVRFPDGTMATPGQRIGGAYPWIDRAGANIFLGGHHATFGWKTCDMKFAGGDPATSQDCPDDVSDDVNAKNAKAPRVVGLWTRGKVVYLDGVMNGSDWTAWKEEARDNDDNNPKSFDNHSSCSIRFDKHFFVASFRDAPWEKVRPGNNNDFFTYENIFNHLDHMTPLYPNDVVWTATAGSNHVLGEVPFDDYLSQEALVLAPMNDRLRMVPNWVREAPGAAPVAGVHHVRRDNGMDHAMLSCEKGGSTPAGCPSMSNLTTGTKVTLPDVRGERFAGTGIFLQNNANPAGALPRLSLKGGAYIPPISTGVIGKAVYLDGANDHIKVDSLPYGVSSYYLGMWVHPDDHYHRVLFTFPDGSAINTLGHQIQLRWGGTPQHVQGCFTDPRTASASPGATRNRWTHFGFARSPSGALDIYVDGTLQATHHVGSAFQLAEPGPYRFVVGQDRDVCHAWHTFGPARGWVDELKIFELQTGEYGSHQFHERACNHALGSLRADGTCEQIDFRQTDTLDCYGAGGGLEFPVEAYRSRDCGSSAHRHYVRDPASGCDRPHRLGLAEIDPGQPRPNDVSNDFCLSCHTAPPDPAALTGSAITDFDITTNALTYDPSIDATDDRRRQPLSWFQQYDHILWDGQKNVQIGCGVGFREIGRFGTWWGKVNIHRQVDGPWQHDPDCVSGANQKDLNYCQKFWPSAVSLHRTVLGPERKDQWMAGNCSSGPYTSRGHEEWVCCEPEP
ncbi:MAG: LamG-like jellyroll fold domain-containing protein [Acidobacteriota bacterium]